MSFFRPKRIYGFQKNKQTNKQIGNIDSKDHSPNEYLGPEFDKTPWSIGPKKASKSLIVPLNLEPEYKVQTERPRPSPRTVPKVESVPKSESPLHSTFALTFNNQQNPRVVARTRASTTTTTNSRRGNALDLLPNLNNQPSSNRFKASTVNQNSRSRLPVYTNTGRNTAAVNYPPSTIATTPSTTTTTTTTAAPLIASNSPKTDPKSADYIYDYVEYDAPAPNAPASNSQAGSVQPNKPIPLPALPTLDEAQPNRNANSIPKSNSNIGSLFSGTINHQPLNNQQPPRISQPSSQSNAPRPPQRNQLPQTSSLNYFNSNPFSSNPFASNPFSNSNSSPNLIRQKRENNDELIKADDGLIRNSNEEDAFSCHDKLPGIGYADVQSRCVMFHICLPLSKGKYKVSKIDLQVCDLNFFKVNHVNFFLFVFLFINFRHLFVPRSSKHLNVIQDYQLFCENDQGFNQFNSNCEPLDKFDCKKSKDFYLYNKQINLDSYLKNRFRISKQLADIKN